MEISFFAFVVVLVAAFGEHVPVEKFLSAISKSENVLYLILDCEESNLRTATELFAGLASGTSDSRVNIITIPLSNGGKYEKGISL